MSFDSKKAWTDIEDLALITVVDNIGTKNWTLVSIELKRSGNYHRTGKQCRERWHNHLDPKILKAPWTSEEDDMIFELYKKLGRTWSKISEFLPGRSDNSVKNRFYSHLRKKLRSYNKSRPHCQRIIGSIRSILRDSEIIDFLLSPPQTQDSPSPCQNPSPKPKKTQKSSVQAVPTAKCNLYCPQPLPGVLNDDSSLEDAKLLMQLFSFPCKTQSLSQLNIY